MEGKIHIMTKKDIRKYSPLVKKGIRAGSANITKKIEYNKSPSPAQVKKFNLNLNVNLNGNK